MNVPISDAKAQLTDLVRRAEAGEDVVLTCHGHAAVRLVPVGATLDRPARRALLGYASRSLCWREPKFIHKEQG